MYSDENIVAIYSYQCRSSLSYLAKSCALLYYRKMSAEVPTDDQQSNYPTENDIEYGLPPYSDQDTYPLTGPPAASESAITPLDQYYPAVPSGKS